MTETTKWEVASCPAPPYEGARERMDSLLADGWEPFAATMSGPVTGVRYHFRRQLPT